MKKIRYLKRKWQKLKITDKVQIIQTLILFFTLIGAIWIGVRQNEINERFKNLQDYAAISVIMPSKKGAITLRNTGNINLYLWGFEIFGKRRKHDRPRLVGVGVDCFIYIGEDLRKEILDNKEFEFKVYFEDEFGQKWISEHGGKVISSAEDGDKEFTSLLWSYKIEKNNWSF